MQEVILGGPALILQCAALELTQEDVRRAQPALLLHPVADLPEIEEGRILTALRIDPNARRPEATVHPPQGTIGKQGQRGSFLLDLVGGMGEA